MGWLLPWEGKVNVGYKLLNTSFDQNIACYKCSDYREGAKRCDKERQRGVVMGIFHCLTYRRTPWLSERLEHANRNKKINHKCKDIHEEFFKIFIKTHTTCRS